MLSLRALFLSVIVLVAMLRPSDACTLLFPHHELDPAYADDAVPPAAPTVIAIAYWRGEPDPNSTCNPSAGIRLWVEGTDDRAPSNELGYQIRAVGRDPVGLAELPPQDPTTHEVFFRFDYNTPSFDADYELVAVDLNGNVGPPTTFHVSYELGDSGCSAGGGSSPWVALALLALLYARRDARAPARGHRVPRHDARD